MTLSFKRDWPAAALVVATAILIVPLWCVRTPAMPDLPAHLAGFYLIAGGAETAPVSTYYAVHWHLLPNLASEIVVPLLARVTSLDSAARLFLSIAVAMWVLGPAAIQRALTGRLGPAPLAGALFAYNANFTWGFLNYYFAAGLSFLGFAAWIAAGKRRTPTVLAAFAVGAFALYVCHLFGACLLAVMIASYELAAAWRERAAGLKAWTGRALPVVLVFLPAALAFLLFKVRGGAVGDIEFNYSDTMGDRVGSLMQWYFGEPAYLPIGGLLIAVFAGLLYGLIRFRAAMKLPVLGIAALALVSPEWAFGGWGVDLRLPAVLGALVFASLEPRLSSTWNAAVAAVLLLTAGVSADAIADNWRSRDRQYGEFRAALGEVPEGAKIFTVLDGDALDDTADQPYWHMAEFAIIDRGAFTPLMFTTRGQHVVQPKQPYDALAAATAQQGSPPDVTELSDLAAGRVKNDPDIEESYPYLKFFRCHFDLAVVVTGEGEPSDVPSFMTLRHAGSFFSIYDIRPPRTCAKP